MSFKKFLAVFVVTALFSVGFINTKVYATEVPVSWQEPDSGTIGFKVYYDNDGGLPMNGTGAVQGDSPIVINDPNVRSLNITGLATAPKWYIRISAFDDEEEGPLSDARYYSSIQSFVPVSSPGAYGVDDTVVFSIVFPETVFLNNGLLRIILNTGKVIDVSTINWQSSININYIVGEGEEADPLSISDIYLDPNDPDDNVRLYDQAMKDVCTDMPDTNLDSDPNALIIIDTSAPNPPTFYVGCCSN